MQVEINNKTKVKISAVKIERLAIFFGKHFNLKNKVLSLAFVGDKTMSRINSEYRGLKRPTDILSFEGEGDFLGELIIDCAQLKRQAPFYSENFYKELEFIIMHGLLHLVGYNDETEEDRLHMIAKGKELLALFNNLDNLNKKYDG
jgi:probable rRNA maturation factor